MKSTSYIQQHCPKCYGHRYREGSSLAYQYMHTWVDQWLHEWCHPSIEYRGWIGICQGCHNVGIGHFKCLAILLYKLKVRVKR